MTGTGLVCGESASSAPTMITSSAPSSLKPSTSSRLNPRQRMFGSMPCTRMMSLSSPAGLTWASLVVGHESLRVWPSVTSSTGLVTWKS